MNTRTMTEIAEFLAETTSFKSDRENTSTVLLGLTGLLEEDLGSELLRLYAQECRKRDLKPLVWQYTKVVTRSQDR